MSILIDETTRVIVQGITGATARADTERCLRSGTKIVAGVSPGRGGEEVHGVPVYDTVQCRACASTRRMATAIYVPPQAARDAVAEALDAGLKLLLVTAEYVPIHDVLYMTAAARAAGALLVGCNTNGIISAGKSRIGGIGGINPDETLSARLRWRLLAVRRHVGRDRARLEGCRSRRFDLRIDGRRQRHRPAHGRLCASCLRTILRRKRSLFSASPAQATNRSSRQPSRPEKSQSRSLP